MAWYDSPNNPLSGFLGGVVQHQEKDQALRQKIGLLQYQQQIASDATTATRRYDVLNKDIDLNSKRYDSLVRQEKDLLAIIWDPQQGQFHNDAVVDSRLKSMNAGVAWNPTSIKSMLDSIKRDKAAAHRLLNEGLKLRHSLYGIPGVNYQNVSTEPTLEEKFQALTSPDPRATGQASTGSTATTADVDKGEPGVFQSILKGAGSGGKLVASALKEQVESGNLGFGQNNVFNRYFKGFMDFASDPNNPVHNLYKRAAEILGIDPSAVTDTVMDGVNIGASAFAPNFANQAFEWLHKQAGVAPENTADFWLNEGLRDRMVEIMQAAGGDFEKFKVLAADKFKEYIRVTKDLVVDATGIGAIEATLTGPTQFNILGATITVTPQLEVTYRQRARDELQDQDRWMEILESDVESRIEATRLDQQAQAIQAGANEFDVGSVGAVTETADDTVALSETPATISVVPEYEVFQQRLAQAASAPLPSTFGAQPQVQSSPAGAQSPAAMPASLLPNQQGVAQPPTASAPPPMAQGDPTAAGGLGGGMPGSGAQPGAAQQVGLSSEELDAIIEGHIDSNYPRQPEGIATGEPVPGVDQFQFPDIQAAIHRGVQPHRPSDLMSDRDLTLAQFPGWPTLEGEVQFGDMGVDPNMNLEQFMTTDELVSSRYNAVNKESIEALESFINNNPNSALVEKAQNRIQDLRNIEEFGSDIATLRYIKSVAGDAGAAAWKAVKDLNADELAEWFSNPNNQAAAGSLILIGAESWRRIANASDLRKEVNALARAEGVYKTLEDLQVNRASVLSEIEDLKETKPTGWEDDIKKQKAKLAQIDKEIRVENNTIKRSGGRLDQVRKKILDKAPSSSEKSFLSKLKPGKGAAIIAVVAGAALVLSGVAGADTREKVLNEMVDFVENHPDGVEATGNALYILGISSPSGLTTEILLKGIQAIGSPQGAGTGGTTSMFAAPGTAMGSGGLGSLRDPQWTGAYTGGPPAKDIPYNTSGDSVVPEWRPGGLTAEEMNTLQSTLAPWNTGLDAPAINPRSPASKEVLDQILTNRASKKKLIVETESIKDSEIPVDLLYKAIHAAEFRGAWKGLRKNWGKNTFIRTRHAPALGSSAYGPLQITKGLMERQRPKLRGVLTREEQSYIDRFIDQANTFLKYGREPDLEGYQKRYDYGGAGDLNSRDDMRLYKSVGKKLIALGYREAEGDLVRFARDWRYGDQSEKSLESSDPEYYRAYKRIIDEGNN